MESCKIPAFARVCKASARVSDPARGSVPTKPILGKIEIIRRKKNLGNDYEKTPTPLHHPRCRRVLLQPSNRISRQRPGELAMKHIDLKTRR